MDLETCKQLIAHFEQRKSWSTKTLKTIMFDVVMGKPLEPFDHMAQNMVGEDVGGDVA